MHRSAQYDPLHFGESIITVVLYSWRQEGGNRRRGGFLVHHRDFERELSCLIITYRFVVDIASPHEFGGKVVN